MPNLESLLSCWVWVCGCVGGSIVGRMCGYATCTCTLPVHRGQIVALMGDTLGDKLPECMPIFVDRLRNEITRLTTVRSLSQIAR